MRKTLLVPFDGSESSKQAIFFAISFANKEDRIVLINVQKPQYEGIGKVGNISRESLDTYYLDEGKKVLEAAKKCIENESLKIETIIRIGLPAIEITKAAKELSAHSIVMGSQGMSPVINNALGSVTYSVIHLASCPVTIVPYSELRQ